MAEVKDSGRCGVAEKSENASDAVAESERHQLFYLLHPLVSSSFGINVLLLSALKGGFYFYPTDKDLSVGTPAEKAT